MRSLAPRRVLVMGLVLVLALTGCRPYPADPHATLERATGGVLRVGVVHHQPYVSLAGATPTGDEVELVQRYAATIDARIEWSEGSEGALVTRLEHGTVDMLIGGLANDTAWKKKVGLTRPYATSIDEFGKKQKHVMAVRLGENALLLDLDRFLQEQGGAS